MIAAIIVGSAILALAVSAILKASIPGFKPPDKTGIILLSTILFFISGILDIDDLEVIPWNIILLFAGAMSIGFCLWQTGAAEWLAINWLAMFKESHWFVFVMGMGRFSLVSCVLVKKEMMRLVVTELYLSVYLFLYKRYREI